MTTFTRFSEERRELIAEMKADIKSRSEKYGGLTHADYVLYAALRGQDIRKTSHQPDGENAREVLDQLIRYQKKYENKPPFVLEALEEAKELMEAPMKQAS